MSDVRAFIAQIGSATKFPYRCAFVDDYNQVCGSGLIPVSIFWEHSTDECAPIGIESAGMCPACKNMSFYGDREDLNV